MQAVKAYYDGDKFVPFQPIKVPKGSHAIITIVDFSTGEDNSTSNSEVKLNESRIEWLKRLEEAIDLSMDEELPDWPFQRSIEMRPPLDLRD
jgi:hypothetical protein